MNIAFYVDEMNLRGVANSSYQFAFLNKKILEKINLIFFIIKKTIEIKK